MATEKEISIKSYHEFLNEKRIMGTKCKKCDNIDLPPRQICSKCQSTDVRWQELAGKGKVESFTNIHVGTSEYCQKGYDMKHPYAYCVVKLDEGASISAVLLGIDPSKPETVEIGTSVTARFMPTKSGMTLAFEVGTQLEEVEKEIEEDFMIKKVAVIGAGTMGAGIAQVAAESGFNVVVTDIADEFLQKGLNTIKKFVTRNAEKGKISQVQADAILGRIEGALDLNAAKDADIVIEAAPENMNLKKKIFSDLDNICKPEAIIGTNTSSLSITEIASATKRPENVVGVHFFNPAPIMKLVELIRGYNTSDVTYETVQAFVKKLGKTVVLVNEAPGFVVNRILAPMINEAIIALQEGVASAEGIDTAMKLGLNHPMGPLTLADFIGLDVVLAILDYLYEEFGDPKYKASSLLRKMVRAGQLGRKTGKGFYDYSK
jgi:3-hydroxybutyryl-CoA dehydrogenase